MDTVVEFLQLTAFLVFTFVGIDYFIRRQSLQPKSQPKAQPRAHPTGISNEKKRSVDLLGHYYAVMQIDTSVSLYPSLVEETYRKRLASLVSSDISEEQYRNELMELDAARKYLLDFITYMAYKN